VSVVAVGRWGSGSGWTSGTLLTYAHRSRRGRVLPPRRFCSCRGCCAASRGCGRSLRTDIKQTSGKEPTPGARYATTARSTSTAPANCAGPQTRYASKEASSSCGATSSCSAADTDTDTDTAGACGAGATGAADGDTTGLENVLGTGTQASWQPKGADELPPARQTAP